MSPKKNEETEMLLTVKNLGKNIKKKNRKYGESVCSQPK